MSRQWMLLLLLLLLVVVLHPALPLRSTSYSAPRSPTFISVTFVLPTLTSLLSSVPCPTYAAFVWNSRLRHLRAFAQAGVAQHLEDLIIDDDHIWYSTTHRAIAPNQSTGRALADQLPEAMARAHAERKAAHQAVADELHMRKQQLREQLAAQLAASEDDAQDADVEIDFTALYPVLPLDTAYRASVASGATLLTPVAQLPSIRRIVLFGADVPFCPSSA